MMKPTDHSDILDKVRKLLRPADRSRGATENEAKVALSKAQELMTRHNIDSALLRMEAGEKCGINVTKGLYELPKSRNPADMLILSLLQSHFNVRIILMTGHRKTPVDIIGAPEDVDFAIFALSFLRQTFDRMPAEDEDAFGALKAHILPTLTPEETNEIETAL